MSKVIRISEGAMAELLKRQKPGESLSDTIERLLDEHAQGAVDWRDKLPIGDADPRAAQELG